MSENTIHSKIAVLIQMALDGALEDEQFQEMVSILKSSPQARRYYAQVIATTCIIYRTPSLERNDTPSNECTNDSFDFSLWQALLQDEKEAETLTIFPDSVPVGLITDVSSRKKALKGERKPIAASFWFVLASFAAMLLMMIYIYLNPRSAYEVATVTDSFQAEWSSSVPLQKGGRLAASLEQIELYRGVIKVMSDKGVKVILEAPAKFRFLSSEEVVLYHGRLYAHVPESGSGFSVQASNSKIIDLGTKFGVYADMKGETELHLFKGKTLLISGPDKGFRQTTEVSDGHALHINHTGQLTKEVPLKHELFVHEIDSQAGIIWRGQKVINLADVVGGGDGFGSGKQNMGIDPVTGDMRKVESMTRRARNAYSPVASNIFIDGVFVPNGFTEQTVTTTGLLFSECPSTSSCCYGDIANTPSVFNASKRPEEVRLFLNQTDYSQSENPCIFLHANAGITFDLNQYRSRLPGIDIMRFETELGISEMANQRYVADFWILIDGQVKYHNVEALRSGMYERVSIDIGHQDRFLTLITTDGINNGIEQDRNPIGYDWGIFGRPFLILR